MHWAAGMNAVPLFELLLEYGADIHAKDVRHTLFTFFFLHLKAFGTLIFVLFIFRGLTSSP